MKATTLNHAHPSIMEARYIEEIRKMSPQQRFEKLMAIIEIWKYFSLNRVKYLTIGGFAVNSYGYGRNTGDIDILDIEELEKLNKKNDC